MRKVVLPGLVRPDGLAEGRPLIEEIEPPRPRPIGAHITDRVVVSLFHGR